ncbi:maltokinase N-terminal cap-like domain-containing protein [Cellulomonas timonensis]|uniref:maltokinase N-terminal cap-like domain-containing protein n=1 Tax=Cellulomonas timonensis TaxID=1689271 RepID=UPI000832E396|nr:hypothetical protein [Cellulomonas timonensis]
MAAPGAADDLVDGELVQLLADWLPERRWFPVKGVVAALDLVGARELIDPRGEARVRILFVRATAPGTDVVLQIPVTLRLPGGPGGPDEGVVASWIGVAGAPPMEVHDGCGDPAFLRAWLAAADGPGAAVDPERARVLTGEQSNTSVVLPADDAVAHERGLPPGPAILKVFRTLSPGDNPDVDVPRALAAHGWRHVPRPLGWLDGAWPDRAEIAEGHLAVLSQFLSGAQDGFELACAMAGRGGSFAAHARALGGVVAGMHGALAAALPVPPPPATVHRASSVAQAVRDRFRWAAAAVPVLDKFAGAVEDLAVRTQHLDRLPAPQRIHGDLHLGQALYADDVWFITDFEGEPLAPVAARIRPDLALRDVAGMLRSFDYAAAVGAASGADGIPDEAAALAWTDSAREGLLVGYRDARLCAQPQHGADGDPDAISLETRAQLLRALELDKALYEAVYEARNRPAWLPIPLMAITRLLA